MTDQEKLEMLETIMDTEENTLTGDTVLEELDEWDSLSKLSLTMEVKTKLHKDLDIKTLQGFKTIKDILDYMG